MASSQTVLAILRGIRPRLRGQADRVAIALHAFLLSLGYKLVATGRAADDLADVSPDLEEVGLDGWQDLDNSYAFAYLTTSGKSSSLQVQALPVDKDLVINILFGAEMAPEVTSIEMDSVTSDSTDLIGGYKDLEPMLRKVEAILSSTKEKEGGKSSRESFESQVETASKPEKLPKATKNTHPGADDLDPPEMPNPYQREERETTGYLGGMHVGPFDPIFAGPQQNRHGLPTGPFPGVRYDPTNPAGLEGFNAEDFQRRRGTHPDMMPPGGGGTSSGFESFFR